jgi:mono/diheme cytochrome c family protein
LNNAPRIKDKLMPSMQRWITPFLGFLLLAGNAAAAGADDVAQGRKIYLEYCASCHGLTGEGDGPVARSLTTPPANLRLLSDRFGNPLPEDQVARFIDGRAEVKAHGPRDMPVWGLRFYAETGSERQVKDRIAKLVAYLQSIQTGMRHANN